MTSAVVRVQEPSASSGPGDSCSLVHLPKRRAQNSRAALLTARESFSGDFLHCPRAYTFHLSWGDGQSSYLPGTMENRCYWVFLASCWDTEAISVDRCCLFTKSGLSRQSPSSLFNFILIKSPNTSLTLPKPSTKALGSFMFLCSFLYFHLPYTSVTT